MAVTLLSLVAVKGVFEVDAFILELWTSVEPYHNNFVDRKEVVQVENYTNSDASSPHKHVWQVYSDVLEIFNLYGMIIWTSAKGLQ